MRYLVALQIKKNKIGKLHDPFLKSLPAITYLLPMSNITPQAGDDDAV